MYNLQEIYKIITETLNDIPNSQVVIAGGAVRDTLMGREPKDFDVFILNGNYNYIYSDEEEKSFIDSIKNKLNNFKKVDIKLEWHKSEPFLIESIYINSDMQEIQIMVSPHPNINKLLDSFDWNISLFAYDGKNFYQRELISEIAEGKYLKLQNCLFPYSTLRRGYRFSERFKMRLETKDINLICNEIIKLNNKTSKDE